MRSLSTFGLHRLLPALGAAWLLAAFGLSGCGRGGGPAHDLFGAYNTLGGARRANDFSLHNASPASVLGRFDYKSLGGGFLAPPLELPLGRMAVIARSDSASTLAVLYRDSIIGRYRFPAGQYPMPGIAADSSGTLYVVTSRGMLKAFSAVCAPLWEHRLGGDSTSIVVPSPPLALDNGVVAGNSAGFLVRYDRAGRQLWAVQRGASVADPFAADPELGIALSVTHNSYDTGDTLVVLDPATGRQRWSAPVAGRIVQGPVIAGNAIVIGVATNDSNERRNPSVAAFTWAGKPAWHAPLPLMPRGIAADGAGNLYVSCSGAATGAMGGAMISFDTTGHRRWTVTLGSGIPSAAAVSSQWIFFLSRRDGRTGLFTYSHDGVFNNFISIDTFPDVLALPMISSLGELLMSGLDQPVLLRGG